MQIEGMLFTYITEINKNQYTPGFFNRVDIYRCMLYHKKWPQDLPLSVTGLKSCCINGLSIWKSIMQLSIKLLLKRKSVTFLHCTPFRSMLPFTGDEELWNGWLQNSQLLFASVIATLSNNCNSYDHNIGIIWFTEEAEAALFAGFQRSFLFLNCTYLINSEWNMFEIQIISCSLHEPPVHRPELLKFVCKDNNSKFWSRMAPVSRRHTVITRQVNYPYS